MKKTLLTLFEVLLSANITHAAGLDPSANFDHGLIYSSSKFPQSVAASVNTNPPKNLNELKKGESTATNVLGLVETGDASIEAAAKNGGIKKISYIDVNVKSIFIFWAKTTVTVYGE